MKLNGTHLSIAAYWGVCWGLSLGIGVATDFSDKFLAYENLLIAFSVIPIIVDLMIN